MYIRTQMLFQVKCSDLEWLNIVAMDKNYAHTKAKPKQSMKRG